MKRILYLECTSGISGDMTVGALLDLGADPEGLRRVLKSLPLGGFDTVIRRVKKAGLDACDFDVRLDVENHDHDMEYLYARDPSGEHRHLHEEHSHEKHPHEAGHAHAHRGMREIRSILDACRMTDGARSLALRIFGILAEAEAEAHGVSAEEVHFHEVGAVDSIVDIVAAAYCFDDLGISDVAVSRLCEGQGTVRCQHGLLPVPVPAVANIVSRWELPLELTGVRGELVTPTGAAVAAAVRTQKRLPERFVIEKTGIGAGKREYDRPGILRAMILRCEEENGQEFMESRAAAPGRDRDAVWKLETNIDDTSGENLGYVMGRLLESGARDVFYTPVFMKKNRPAWLLSVICGAEDISRMEEILFTETTTIGVRRMKMERSVLAREEKTVRTPLGEIAVKVCTYGEQTYVYPEYESLAALCRKNGISYKEALRLAAAFGSGETD